VSKSRAVFILPVLATLLGCAVGPDYRKPETAVPQQWAHVEDPGLSTGAAEVTRWWQTLNDPTLDSLIDRAVSANHDLQIATARVREARALRGVAAADQFPTIDASGAYSRVRESENVPLAGAGQEFNLFLVGFDASWEVDLFGRVRRSVEAADAEAAAAEENRRDVLVTLLAEVARNYVEVRGFQGRLRIAHDNIRTQQQTLELAQARFAAGLSSELDVAQARANLATTRSQVPALESALAQTIHRLGVLLGQEPGALLHELARAGPIPPGPESVPVGLPSDLLRRRADVRRVERELGAATARIGVAVADLFPRVSLTGAIDLQASDVDSLFTPGSRFWSVGPRLIWPVFDAGRIRANIGVQTARQEAAFARYERVVLVSLEEVENALVAYLQEQIRRRSLAEAVDANRRAVDLSSELYLRGLTDFLDVLESQRSLYASEDQLVQSERAVAVSLIALYKALGGGWEEWLPDKSTRSHLSTGARTVSRNHDGRTTSKEEGGSYGQVQ
jgi:NodT family efflux transporter outer membrane factor (OMF) lipoprotein